MNIHFNLAEIYHRKLRMALKGLQDPKTAIRIHEKIVEEFKAISKDYFSNAQRGKNRPALESYNDLLRTELGIDKIKLFILDEKKEEN